MVGASCADLDNRGDIRARLYVLSGLPSFNLGLSRLNSTQADSFRLVSSMVEGASMSLSWSFREDWLMSNSCKGTYQVSPQSCRVHPNSVNLIRSLWLGIHYRKILLIPERLLTVPRLAVPNQDLLKTKTKLFPDHEIPAFQGLVQCS